MTHDDKVFFGVNQEDHNANLINLLTFFGAKCSTQGMHSDPKKVQGITEMTVPTDKQQL